MAFCATSFIDCSLIMRRSYLLVIVLPLIFLPAIMLAHTHTHARTHTTHMHTTHTHTHTHTTHTHAHYTHTHAHTHMHTTHTHTHKPKHIARYLFKYNCMSQQLQAHAQLLIAIPNWSIDSVLVVLYMCCGLLNMCTK